MNGAIYSIGGGQVTESLNIDEQVSKTLNCMHDAGSVLICSNEINSYGMDATQISMHNMRECSTPLLARMWKDPNIVIVKRRR